MKNKPNGGHLKKCAHPGTRHGLSPENLKQARPHTHKTSELYVQVEM